MVPATLAVIFVLLYLLFRSAPDALLVMAAVPLLSMLVVPVAWLLLQRRRLARPVM